QPHNKRPTCDRDPSFDTGPRPLGRRARAARRTRPPPSPACTGGSASSAVGRRSAGAGASGRCGAPAPWPASIRSRALRPWRDRGGPASSERCPQTGNGGRVSYARLVLDLDRTEGGVQLLHEVVLLVVEGRSSEAGDAHRPPDHALAGQLVLPYLTPGGDDPVGDHVHRGVER